MLGALSDSEPVSSGLLSSALSAGSRSTGIISSWTIILDEEIDVEVENWNGSLAARRNPSGAH